MASMSSTVNPAQGHLSVPEDVPGDATFTTTRMMEATASTMQSLSPIKNFNQHVCTWAMYSQDMSRTIETHHHASRLNEDVVQCVVYDSPQPNARIIGVEYIVSEKVFATIPAEEKKLWHSHYREIKTGLWINPGVPEMMGKEQLKKLSHTYGKFWLFWQFDRGDRLPFGPPALMMSPQAEEPGTVPPAMIQARDKHFQVNTQELAEARTSFEPPAGGIDPLSDEWRSSGMGWSTEMKQVPMQKDTKQE